MAYCLGIISTDGNVYKNTISVTCHRKDIDLLVFLSDSIGPGVPVEYRKDRNECRIRFNSREMVSDLQKLGIHPNKSLTIEPPVEIPDDFLYDYLRGVFDGDGTVQLRGKSGLSSEIYSGSSLFISKLRERCNNIGKIYAKQGKRKKDKHPIYVWNFSKRESLSLRSNMYNQECFCLLRKKNIFWSQDFSTENCQIFWKKEEVDFLISHSYMKDADIGKLLNRTTVSIQKKRRKLLLPRRRRFVEIA